MGCRVQVSVEQPYTRTDYVLLNSLLHVVRGIIFIDLAIAQVAGLGVIAADTMGWEAEGWMVQIAAVSAALVAAGILHWTDKHWPDIQDALIGGSFILAATAGILLLAGNPQNLNIAASLLARLTPRTPF